MSTEDSYPYLGYDSSCKVTSGSGSIKVTSHSDVAVNDPSALLAAVNRQPVSVAIEAD